MNSVEHSVCRSYLLGLCRQLNCYPEELPYFYRFHGDLNKIVGRLVFEHDLT